MDIYDGPYTTRMMRRLRPDLIPWKRRLASSMRPFAIPMVVTLSAGISSPLTIGSSSESSLNCFARLWELSG
jgi:hypothetical protein